MPLQRATKSVIFHDGIADGTDRFLVEPPAVDYAENVHPHKDGSFQKRPGFGDSEIATVPNATGDPCFIGEINNVLHVIAENGARSWDGTAWRETNISGFVGTSATEIETPNIQGLGNCDFMPGYDTNGDIAVYYAVHEIRERGTTTYDLGQTPRHVIVQYFDADKNYVGQWRYSNGYSPRLVQMSDPAAGSALPFVGLVFQLQVGGNLQWVTLSSLAAPSPTDARPSNTSLLIGAENEAVMRWYADVNNGPRLGQGVRDHARYQASWDAENLQLAIFYTLPNKDVRLTTFDVSGVLQDFVNLETTYNADILALNYHNGFLYALYTTWVTPPLDTLATGLEGDQLVWLAKVDGATLSSVEKRSLFFQNSEVAGPGDPGSVVFTHGSVATKTILGNTPVSYVALHRSGKQSWAAWTPYELVTNPDAPLEVGQAHYFYPWNNRATDAGVTFYEYDWDTLTQTTMTTVTGQRLATDLQLLDDELYVGLQQWIDHTPQHTNPGDMNRYTSVVASSKPVTTVLCVIEEGVAPTPVAYVDAGASSVCDYVQSESFIHLCPLLVDGDDFLLANRVKLSLEDSSLYLGAANSVWKRTANTLSQSDSMLRVHRVRKGRPSSTQSFNASKLGDGFVLSTAIPSWFDGSAWNELGPLESPEIMRIEDAAYEDPGFNNNNRVIAKFPPLLYEVQAGSPGAAVPMQNPRKFQAVVGYKDAGNNTHRSAPSATVYEHDLPSETTPTGGEYLGRDLTVYVTPPLTAQATGLEYFCEVYVSSNEDDDPQLAGSTTFAPSSDGSPIEVEVQANFATASDIDSVIPVLRTTEAAYTSGGGLAADPWPVFALSVATSTRLWAIDSSRKGRVMPSKLFEDYVSPEYNSTLVVNLGDERNLTAIGKLDDKVVVFEPNDIHVIYGEGPDNRGQGQDFAVHYISTDVGCEDQQSVVETPAGLIFYSKPRGFYMLDRNLQIRFIGEGVEEVARDIDVVAATLVSEFGEVRFIVSEGTLTPDVGDELVNEAPQPVLDAGVYNPPRPRVTNSLPTEPCLVYSYEKDAWTVYSNYSGSTATMYQNKYTMLNPDWSIWQENPLRFDDPSGDNRMLLKTPWIRLSEQIQNYARLWRVTFLGRYLSSLQDMGSGVYEAGDVIVRAWFDYEAGIDPQEKRYRFQDFGFDPFNAVPLRGERFQFKWTPERGRCQAVKFEIEEVNSEDRGEGLTYTLGAGFEIVAADIEVGVSGMQTRYLQAGVSK